MRPWYHWDGDDLILLCRLQPKASSDEMVGDLGDELKIRITGIDPETRALGSAKAKSALKRVNWGAASG